MQIKDNKLSFSGQYIYIGIDVHLRSWCVTILVGEIEHKTYSMTPCAESLIRYLHKYFPEGKYLCAYESGFSGFWLQRQLQTGGVDCIVVNAADVPRSDKDRRNKTDSVDSRRLAKGLLNKQMKSIYIPSTEEVEDRGLLRTRESMVRNQTRCKNRIKSMLYYHGIKVEPGSTWSENYIKQIESLEEIGESLKKSINILVQELRRIKVTIKELDQQIKVLSQSPRYHARIELLKTVPGIGLLTGMIMLTEIINISRFSRDDELCSYAGLIPTEHSSGARIIKGSVTPRRNKVLRHILTESAWTAARKDPALMSAYYKFTKQGIPKNKAIIKIARKLLCRISHVLRENEPYSIAVVS